MDYNDLTNPKLKEIIDGLQYNSASIENDVLQALEEADNEKDFIWKTQSFLDTLGDEVKAVNQDFITANNTELTIYIEGGVIHDITGIPEDTSVKVVDWDKDGIEEDRLTKLEAGMALVSEWKPDGSADFIRINNKRRCDIL